MSCDCNQCDVCNCYKREEKYAHYYNLYYEALDEIKELKKEIQALKREIKMGDRINRAISQRELGLKG